MRRPCVCMWPMWPHSEHIFSIGSILLRMNGGDAIQLCCARSAMMRFDLAD